MLQCNHTLACSRFRFDQEQHCGKLLRGRSVVESNDLAPNATSKSSLPSLPPLLQVLDWLLGTEHGALFRRPQLKALVDIHSQENDQLGGYLAADELAVIRGALDLTGKHASVGMTPLDKARKPPSHMLAAALFLLVHAKGALLWGRKLKF